MSQGKLVTLANFNELFDGILNPKQLDGLRLLVTPFPQQQFNATDDRRSKAPHRGVTCFDCHVNGHTNAATPLVGDIRPQEFRHSIDTPSCGRFKQESARRRERGPGLPSQLSFLAWGRNARATGRAERDHSGLELQKNGAAVTGRRQHVLAARCRGPRS